VTLHLYCVHAYYPLLSSKFCTATLAMPRYNAWGEMDWNDDPWGGASDGYGSSDDRDAGSESSLSDDEDLSSVDTDFEESEESEESGDSDYEDEDDDEDDEDEEEEEGDSADAHVKGQRFKPMKPTAHSSKCILPHLPLEILRLVRAHTSFALCL
jgi:hypothetical protein